MVCAERVPLFKGRIDKERVSLSVNSRQFATLSAVQSATTQLLGELAEDTSAEDLELFEDLAVEFWTTVTDLVEPRADIASGDVKAHEARATYVSSYALALWAIGSAGASALDNNNDGWARAGGGRARCLATDGRPADRVWQDCGPHGGNPSPAHARRRARLPGGVGATPG